MTKKKPVLSVVIPVYNKENSVGSTIQSVLEQSVSMIELVIVNDGSTDESANTVRQFDDPRIVFIEQPNAGVAAARNLGILTATSDLIAFLDADDEWQRDYVETILELVDSYPECAVYATSYVIKHDDAYVMPKIPFQGDEGVLHDYFSIARKGSPPLWTGAVCAKKEALIFVGMFNAEIKAGEDLLCWAKLAQAFDIAFFNEPKAVYNFPIKVDDSYDLRLPDQPDLVYPELVMMCQIENCQRRKKDIDRYIGHWCKIRLHIFTFKGMKRQALAEYLKLLNHDPFNAKAFLLAFLAISPVCIRKGVWDSAKRIMN